MREPQKGDRVIQRTNSTEWVVVSVTETKYDQQIKMRSVGSGRTINKLLYSMERYKFVDTGELVIPRDDRSNGYSDADLSFICRQKGKTSYLMIASKLERSVEAVRSQVYRMKKEGLFDKYASM